MRANAYDLVINGVEIGGGSIRIHDASVQKLMFKVLGFTEEEANEQFGFLLNAFKYGAPPHGGIAFGFDRWVAMFGGQDSIRDFIAFPKNNSGRDVMLDTPSRISEKQLNELHIISEGNKDNKLTWLSLILPISVAEVHLSIITFTYSPFLLSPPGNTTTLF